MRTKKVEKYYEYYDKFESNTFSGQKVHILFTNDIYECVNEALKNNNVVDKKRYMLDKGTTVAVCEDIQDVNFRGIILIFDINNINNGFIVHECFHATYHLLDYIGMTLKSSSEEAFAYFMEALFNRCVEVKNAAKVDYKKFKSTKQNEHNREV